MLFRSRDDGRPVVILYIGNCDPAGVLIDFALERELREHLSPDIDCFKRVGITAEQVEAYDLPSKPRKGKRNAQSTSLRR